MIGNAPAPVPVRVSLLEHAVAAPSYQTEHAAGMDLVAAVSDSVEIPAGGIVSVPTGIRIEIPTGYEGQVRPRSGLAARHGIGIPNAPGTIDCDYRGEVQVLLVNFGSAPYVVRRGDRIAQLVLAPVVRAALTVTSELTETARGAGGFGHTGR
jgi:dUTP pyrophosphatase